MDSRNIFSLTHTLLDFQSDSSSDANSAKMITTLRRIADVLKTLSAEDLADMAKGRRDSLEDGLRVVTAALATEAIRHYNPEEVRITALQALQEMRPWVSIRLEEAIKDTAILVMDFEAPKSSLQTSFTPLFNMAVDVQCGNLSRERLMAKHPRQSVPAAKS